MKDDDVAFLLLSNESADTVRSFLETDGYSLPVYLYTDPLPSSLDATSFPTTYIVDAEGMVVFKYKLTAKWDDLSTGALPGLRVGQKCAEHSAVGERRTASSQRLWRC